MDEFALIDRYLTRLGAARADVVLGVGDDGALVRPPPPGYACVLVTDTMVSDVHFPARLAAHAVGHRALAVNLSDVAAMGALPGHALLALSLPDADEDWLAAFAEGLAALARQAGVAVIGGDTTRSPVLTVTVTVTGEVPAGEALTRSGARAGDLLVVSGSPGDAARGLRVLQDEVDDTRAASEAARPAPDAREPPGEATDASGAGLDPARMWLLQRFAWPTPRVACGIAMRSLAHAAIDLSDGLLADAGKLAAASGLVAEIDAETLPLSDALRATTAPDDALRLALTGGDDYELLFAVPAEALSALPAAASAGCRLTAIGRLRAPGPGEAPRAIVRREGQPLPIDAGGYRHFHST